MSLTADNAGHYARLRATLDGVPKGSSVAASTFFTAYLSSREELYDVGHSSKEHLLGCEYIVIDPKDGSRLKKYVSGEEENALSLFEELMEENGYEKIPQIGNAILEDNVEIGANSCVDRAVMGSTIIRKGAKIDNLVQIGHNCEVGSHTVMSAQVGVAGSTKIGEWCMFGGQVGIGGHATIANRTMAGAQSGIPNNVKKEGTAIQGSPAIDGRNFWKSSAIFKNLPDMWSDMNQMKKEIKALKEALEAKQ